MKMKLELGNGNNYDNPTRETVEKALDSLNGEDNDFAIIDSSSSSSDKFLQAAVTGTGFVAEYRDAGGYFRSSGESLSLGEIKKAFLSFLNNDNSWKGMFSWTAVEESGGAEGVHLRQGKQEGMKEGTLVDEILDTVKSNIKSSIKRKIGRFLKF